jgi:hypothetical protein
MNGHVACVAHVVHVVSPDAFQSAPQAIASRGWRLEGEHALVHSTGWSIARYSISGGRVYILWSPKGTSGGSPGEDKHGPFTSTEAAKCKHAELTGWTPEAGSSSPAAT